MSLAWPSDDVANVGTNKFLLRSINIVFPRGELSVISGKTGQCQLLYLVRALLSHPKLMVLAEITSAVAMQTDALIRRTLGEEFTNTTSIVIVHRLSMVIDFDKISLMSNGLMEEFGSPKELVERRGAFWTRKRSWRRL